jgi:hypothetical protein
MIQVYIRVFLYIVNAAGVNSPAAFIFKYPLPLISFAAGKSSVSA